MTILEKRKLAPERDEHLKKGEFTVLNGEYSKNFNVYVVGEKHKEAVDFITGSELMSIGDKERLERLSNELIGKDWFMTFLDLEDYIRTKERALEDYTDRKTWAKKMLVNISNAGFFFSDRTIREYNQDIWKLGE